MDIMVVGEYMSAGDMETGRPFADGLGKMFKGMMRQVGLDPAQCMFTNVMMQKPHGRQSMYGFCGPKSEGIPNMRYLKRGNYVRAEYAGELKRLWSLINHHEPNLILAAGDMPLWALTSESSLKNARGRITPGNAAIHGRKVLPCFAPRGIVADWPQRPILLADLNKAKRQSQFPEIRRPQRFIHIEPTLEDMEDFLHEYIVPSPILDCDIETKQQMITCVGFAPSKDRALVVPFFTEAQPDGNYWRTKRDEYLAWTFIRRVLSLGKAVGGQNYSYDMQYLWRFMGIKNPDFAEDTMLMHHALQPEMQKGLGFLGSIYTDELSWKFMHKSPSSDKSVKKGDTE